MVSHGCLKLFLVIFCCPSLTNGKKSLTHIQIRYLRAGQVCARESCRLTAHSRVCVWVAECMLFSHSFHLSRTQYFLIWLVLIMIVSMQLQPTVEYLIVFLFFVFAACTLWEHYNSFTISICMINNISCRWTCIPPEAARGSLVTL